MVDTGEHSNVVEIANRMGFHVRPVQRFAEMARMFKADVEVELRGRRVPGKSVMNLMSLGGRRGDKLKIVACGEDARQCVAALSFLAASRFFVEDSVDVSAQVDRHVMRLAAFASCFASDVVVELDCKKADGKDAEMLATLQLTPRSEPAFEISGPDARQARAVLTHLVAKRFYVEDALVEDSRGTT